MASLYIPLKFESLQASLYNLTKSALDPYKFHVARISDFQKPSIFPIGYTFHHKAMISKFNCHGMSDHTWMPPVSIEGKFPLREIRVRCAAEGSH